MDGKEGKNDQLDGIERDRLTKITTMWDSEGLGKRQWEGQDYHLLKRCNWVYFFTVVEMDMSMCLSPTSTMRPPRILGSTYRDGRVERMEIDERRKDI